VYCSRCCPHFGWLQVKHKVEEEPSKLLCALLVLARTPLINHDLVRARWEAPASAALPVRQNAAEYSGGGDSAVRLPGSRPLSTLRNTVPEIFPSVNSVLDAFACALAIGAEPSKQFQEKLRKRTVDSTRGLTSLISPLRTAISTCLATLSFPQGLLGWGSYPSAQLNHSRSIVLSGVWVRLRRRCTVTPRMQPFLLAL